MKKFISLSVAIMLLGMGVVFVACQKTSVETAPKTNKNEVKGSNLVARVMTPSLTLVGCVTDGTLDCVPPAGDCCAPTEVVGMTNIQVMEHIFRDIQIMNAQQIAEVFQNNRDLLINYIDSADIDNVINQQFVVEYSYNPMSNIHFLLFKQQNIVKIAYQFIFVNE